MLSEHFFNYKKTIEATAIILTLHKKPILYDGLIKLLYIADRIALDKMEQPIFGGLYVSTKYGLMIEDTYNLISKPNFLLWSEFFFFSALMGDVTLVKNPGCKELCQEEEEIITNAYVECKNYAGFTFAELKTFSEWQYPSLSTSIPIPIESILKSLGKTNKQIEQINLDLAAQNYLNKKLAFG